MSQLPKFQAFHFALGSEASETEMHRSVEHTPSSSILRVDSLHKRAFPLTLGIEIAFGRRGGWEPGQLG